MKIIPKQIGQFPFMEIKIIYYVDVSQKKYVQNDKIIIKAQDLVPCENGQNIKIINDTKNKLVKIF